MSTYYVDGAVGDDGNAGTSEGVGNAWATIDHAMNTVAAADIVYVKASATYAETATIDTAGGTDNTPIVFEGYTTTTGDGGKVTIDGEATRASCLTDSITGTLAYVFKNFNFTGGTSHGVDLGGNQVIFKNCSASSNGGTGFSTGNGIILENCIANSNGARGFNGGTTCTVVGCRFRSNADDGLRITYGLVFGSEFYDNGVDAIEFLGANGFSCMAIGNTIDGNGKNTITGILFPASFFGPFVAINNIIYDCTTGINGGDQGARLVSRNNLLNSNTADYGTGYTTFDGEVTTAPAFVDEASQDYRLAVASPAIAAGFDATTVAVQPTGISIGALQPADGGGGGASGSGIKTGGAM